ncbi:MAG: hypothetical protein WBB07_15315 [Mycobacterium sp.]
MRIRIDRWQALLCFGAAGALVLSGCGGASKSTDDQPESFSASRIEILVGQSPGGGHDTTARAIADNLGNHLPNNPTIIVRNMPGADDKVMTNYLYNDAKADGSFLGVMNFSIPTYQLQGEGPDQGVRYDSGKFNYLGSPTVTTYVLVLHKRLGIGADNLDELATKKVRMANETPGDGPHAAQAALELGLGWDLEPIFGYEGDSRTLAIERGEVDGVITTWESLEQREAAGIESGDLIAVLTMGVDGPALEDPRLKDAKRADELFASRSEEDRQILAVVQSKFGYARALAAPPNMSPEMVEQFRTAFMEMNEDPAYIERAEASYFVVPTPGDVVQERIEKFMDTPREAVDALAAKIAEESPNR